MRAPCIAWLAAVGALHASAVRAAPAVHNVKVCVRIEEKTWTREGTVAPTPQPPTANAPSEPPGSAVIDDAASRPAAMTAPPPAPTAPSGDLPPSPEPPSEGAPVPTSLPAPLPGAAPQGAATVSEEEADLFSIDPDRYLKRLVEYQVTHEPGFESATSGCAQTLVVELYPVRRGWTAFARYSGNGREEKVDVVRLDELGTFAERVTTALLRDKTIAETLTRTTVLRADSEVRVRQIETRSHLLLGMGSTLRVGMLPTAPNTTGPAVTKFRAETPLSFDVGVRNKFRAWALDATGRLNVGMTGLATRDNLGGGHADFSVGLGLALGFLAYADPDAVNTFYYGGGGRFELSRYQTLGATTKGAGQPAPEGLWGGGLDVDLILGYEFMRTSTLHFFVQGTASLPAYVFDSENDQSRITAYVPSANVQVGILF